MSLFQTGILPSTDFYKHLMDALYDGVYCTDLDRTILYWNPSAERLTGFSAAEVVGKSCADNILGHVNEAGECLCTGVCPLAATMDDGENRDAIVYLHHKFGHRVPVQVRTSHLINEDGVITGGIEIFSNASEAVSQKEQLADLKRQALIDPLTELPNRRYLDEVLDIALEEFKRYGHTFGLVFFDIDHFKSVNDTHGHDVGDDVLKMVANTLQLGSRPSDFVARWGGEEMIAVVRNIDAEGLRDIANRHRALIGTTFLLMGGEKLSVTVSGGATLVREGDTAKTLAERADSYLYRSKENGRNRITDDGDAA